MRNIFFIFLMIFTILIASQQSFKIQPKYQQRHFQLIDKWIFISMETVTKAETEEWEIIYQDDENIETLSFHRSGSMSYVSLEGDEQKKGRGLGL